MTIPQVILKNFSHKEVILKIVYDLFVPSVNSVLKAQNSFRYLGPLIWNSVPSDIRNLDSFDAFKSRIKNWKTSRCPCRLCKNFLARVGFVNVTDT